VKYVPWTNREIARLKECYGAMGEAELIAAFAPRSISSIRAKAGDLKLTRRGRWLSIVSAHVPTFNFRSL